MGELYGEYDNLENLARALAAEYGEGGLDKITRQVRRILGQEVLPPLDTPATLECEEE